VALLVKCKEFSVSLLLFIAILCKVEGDTDSLDLLYFIIFVGIVTILWWQVDSARREHILNKIKGRQSNAEGLVLEGEYQYGLFSLIRIYRDSLDPESNINSSHAYGELIDLLLAHASDCTDDLCVCSELERYY
jgi:hypothetical protein